MENDFISKITSQMQLLQNKNQKSNNIDILVDWNQLKYDVTDFCFLFKAAHFPTS